MFFKSSTTTAPAARSNQNAQTRSSQSKGGIPSLLSGDVHIRGDVISTGEIQVDGVVEGDVIADCLVISEAGTVRGAISAKTVRVLGTVAGAITAGSVRLARTARVSGDIVHKALAIEEGASFLGHCRSEDAEDEAAGESVAETVGEGDEDGGDGEDGARQTGDALFRHDDEPAADLSIVCR